MENRINQILASVRQSIEHMFLFMQIYSDCSQVDISARVDRALKIVGELLLQ